jgi:hypothetical protein
MCRRINYRRASCPKCGDLRKASKDEPCTEGQTKGFGKCKAGITNSDANIVHNCPRK